MKEDKKDTVEKKSKKSLWDGFYYLSIMVIMCVLLLGQQTANAPRVIQGYSVFYVLTSSMEPEVPKDSLVITKVVETSTLQIGDDITFMVGPTTSITHRIVGIVEDYKGSNEPAFETKGVANKQKDSALVPTSNIVGKVVYSNYYLGKAAGFVLNYWYLVLVYLILYLALKKGILGFYDQRDKKLEKKKNQESSTQYQISFEQEIANIYAELEEYYNRGGDYYDS